ncbi:hypothetical protein [Actinotalea sp. K2]|uniref:hypothetical protein n=1 Tax=Actinotalea sp. K2 TaxID=2939438 RepID=UPI0020178438|nr:hypothetical protein [Actinotalea sp. K2]MCL3860888.1 hypothetical protein [Actinotalea sp. K2]
MKRLAATVAVVGVATLGVLLLGHYLGADRNSGVMGIIVVIGVVEGAILCAAWAVASHRRASAAGLVACTILMALSVAGVPPFVAFSRITITWALLTVLAARFVFPARGASGGAPEQPRLATLHRGAH